MRWLKRGRPAGWTGAAAPLAAGGHSTLQTTLHAKRLMLAQPAHLHRDGSEVVKGVGGDYEGHAPQARERVKKILPWHERADHDELQTRHL